MKRANSLIFSLGALTLASCAPSDEDSKDKAPEPFPGYELAKAREGSASPMIGAEAGAEVAPVVDLTVEQLRAKLDTGAIRLIDVRTGEEVANGIIAGAEHVSLDAFDPAKLRIDDGRQVVLYCRSGRRSAIAAQALAMHIGEPVPHLAGGILAWEGAGEAVEKP